jgi:Toprim domain
MPDARELTVGEISDMLRQSADVVASELLPGGKLIHREWHCRGKDSPCGEAISVHVGTGAKRGVVGFWNSSRKGGDLIDLAEIVLGTNKAGAVAWAKEFLGLPSKDRKVDQEVLRRRRIEMEEGRKRREEKDAIERRDKIEYAREIWRASHSSGIGFEYLHSRGLDSSLCGSRELRSHPGLSHSEGGEYPALIGRVFDERRGFAGIWRIYVAADGSGKAPVENPKRGLGASRGGAVRIGGVAPIIGIAEGIETALAVRQLIYEQSGQLIPVWSALSATGMQSVDIPNDVHVVKIFADADPIKFRKGAPPLPSVGVEAAEILKQRLAFEGVPAHVLTPAVGTDWLDVLNAQRAA